MTHNSGYPEVELSLDNIKQILTENDLYKQLSAITFNGNLGDFSLNTQALDIVKFTQTLGIPKISCSTNGSTHTPEWWEQLAIPNVQVIFALDGLEDTHTLYRQQTVWKKVIENAKAFIDAGGKAVWQFIRFQHNMHQEQTCRDMADEMGFVGFDLIALETRNQGPVFAKDGQSISHWLGQPGHPQMTVGPQLESHNGWATEQDYDRHITRQIDYIDCHTVNRKQVYISADGSLYPCCWLGFYPKTMTHPGNNQTKLIMENNNVLENGFKKSMEWFTSVEKSWEQPDCKSGKLYTCMNTCGRCK